jgi:uncharacterized membrane protein
MFDTSHIHPMLVHFPIALVVFGFIADVASLYFKKEAFLSKMGTYLLIVGTLSALATWLSGVLFTAEMSGSAGQVKETHELFAFITIIILVITATLRLYLLIGKKDNSNLKWVAFILYGLATISVSLTGFFGGTLVYSYMIPI